MIISLDLSITSATFLNGDAVIIQKFTSFAFQQKLLLKNSFPQQMRANNFHQDIDLSDNLATAIQDVFSYVNDNGGWECEGWTKRGMVADQAVEQPTNRNEQAQQVQNTELKYNLVRLVPQRPQDIDWDHLDDLKFDPQTGGSVIQLQQVQQE